ncbi:3'-5' exonuclease [Streptomyces mutabilis]|uniref:3'-5' exonuclease n=1 Tax=Streptomyces mutabilis TaxID=67332 RepID=UPI0036AA910F
MTFATWPALLVIDVEGKGTHPPDLVETAALPVRDRRPDKSTAGLAAKPAWADVAERVRAFLGNAWICAHHAHTDYRVLAAHLPGWQPTGVLDTPRLAKATLPELGTYSLDKLIEHVQPDLREETCSRLGGPTSRGPGPRPRCRTSC